MYLPVQMASNLNIDHIGSSRWKDFFHKALSDAEGVLNFCWYDDGFMKKEYCGEYQYINDILLQDRSSLYYTMTGSKTIPNDQIQDIFLAREAISMFLMINKWSLCKQVYSFDAEMELALADSEDIKLPIRVLDRLPYRNLYIEFAKDGIFSSNFAGVFVQVVPYKLGYLLYLCRIKENGSCMFGNCALIPSKEDGIFLINRDDITAENGIERNKDWQEFGFFTLNALLYLCAANAKIKESPITKNTYHPTSTVKNKFSEVRKWEISSPVNEYCGYRYGQMVNLSEQTPKESKRNSISVHSQEKKRSAHMRRAHWHHYWTGPKSGDRKLELRWIPPIMVGLSVKEAVIHKVN